METALRRSLPPGGSVVWEDVSGDNHAYWRALNRHWAPDGDLVVVEHDVVIRPDVLDQFAQCPQPWCVFGYDPICHPECQEAWANMLGCTRFRKELIASCPDAVASIPEPDRPGAADDQRDWHNLCDSIAGDKVAGIPAPLRPASLREAGYAHHWHHPPVRHISWEGHQRG